MSFRGETPGTPGTVGLASVLIALLVPGVDDPGDVERYAEKCNPADLGTQGYQTGTQEV